MDSPVAHPTPAVPASDPSMGGLLGSPAEERFDRITRLASELLDVPAVGLGLRDGDGIWLKSRQGLAWDGVHRLLPLWRAALAADGVHWVEQLALDPAEPRTPPDSDPVRFFAGLALGRSGGAPAGCLMVLDHRPRRRREVEVELLHDLVAGIDQELLRTPPHGLVLGSPEFSAEDRRALVDRESGALSHAGLIRLLDRTLELRARIGAAPSALDGPPELLAIRNARGALLALGDCGRRGGSPERDLEPLAVGQALRRRLEPRDGLAHLGGGRFALLFSGPEPRAVARRFEALRAALEREPVPTASGFRLSSGSLVSAFDVAARSGSDWLAAATARAGDRMRVG